MNTWDQVRIIAEAVISGAGAVGVLIGVWKFIPMLFDGALLLTRLQSAESAAREYRIACEEQARTIIKLQDRNKEQQVEMDQQARDAMDFAVAAGTYIIALVGALKTLTARLKSEGIHDFEPLPPIPEQLEHAIELARKKLEDRLPPIPAETVAPI